MNRHLKAAGFFTMLGAVAVAALMAIITIWRESLGWQWSSRVLMVCLPVFIAGLVIAIVGSTEE